MSFELRREVLPFLRIAAPIIGAQLSYMGMSVVDTLFAGRLGAQPLAAVAVGSHVWMPIFMFFMGVLMAVSPMVAQRVGARADVRTTGALLQAACVIAVGLGAVWMLLLWTIGSQLIAWTGLQPETAAVARDYLRAESFACIAFALLFVLRYGVEGGGRTAPVLWISLAGFAVNALFDWLLMTGAMGFPAMGAVGCGWATVIAAVVMLMCWLLLYLRWRPARAMGVLARRVEALPLRPAWREIQRVGLPIGCILLAEASLFGAAMLLMAAFGDIAVAAHQIAINFAALAFMVPLGFGFAATVRVGHAIGADDRRLARMRGRMAILAGFCFSALSASVMALWPERIAGWYTGDAEVIALAAQLLLLAAAFQLFDCLQATANGALRGLKDTRGPMVITVAAYWGVGLPVAALMAFALGLGPSGLWLGLIAGLLVAAAGLVRRFLHHRSFRNIDD